MATASSLDFRRDRGCSEDHCYPYPRAKSRDRRNVLCARFAVVITMMSVIALVAMICVLAHQAQSRMLVQHDNLPLNPVGERRDLMAFLDFKRMIDQAGSVLIGEKTTAKQTAELLRSWQEENRNECYVTVSRRVRGKCSRNNEGATVCMSGKHTELNVAECVALNESSNL